MYNASRATYHILHSDMTRKPRSVKSPVAEGRDRHNIQGLSFYDPRRQHFQKNKSKILYRYIEFDDRGVFSRAVMGILSELC